MDASEVTCLTDIPIRQLNGPRKAWLSLEGTVLTYRDRTWGRQTVVDIPVELISVAEKKRFMGTRLIGALCWLLFSLVAWAIIGGIAYRADIFPSLASELFFFVLGMAVAVIPFIVLLIRFLFRQRTVSLVIAPHGSSITFWVLKKSRVIVDRLLQELETRQTYVQATISYPHSFSVGDLLEHPWRRTIVLTWVFALPAFVVQRARLFLLCVVPVCMYIWGLIRRAGQPRLFRKAVRACLRKRWEAAQVIVAQLLQHSPSYTPAHLLLIDVYLHLYRFDRAASLLGRIQGDLDPQAVQEIQADIIWARRVWERKQMSTQKADGQVTSESPGSQEPTPQM